MEKQFEVKQVRKEKYKYLREGISPIVACVGTPNDFEKQGFAIKNAHNIDYGGKPAELLKNGFENDGTDSYVISPVDNFDKYSFNLFDCTGIVITGVERETQKNISFMSHQDPNYFLDSGSSHFSESLKKRMQVIKNRCESGTIDAVIVGGRYARVKQFSESDSAKDIFIEEYLKSIHFLSKTIKNELGFEPSVITGPKTIPGRDDIFYDNEHRRLYVVRDKSDFDAVQNFMPSELEERRRNWKPGEWGLPT